MLVFSSESCLLDLLLREPLLIFLSLVVSELVSSLSFTSSLLSASTILASIT